jgi:hypothetical protein
MGFCGQGGRLSTKAVDKVVEKFADFPVNAHGRRLATI